MPAEGLEAASRLFTKVNKRLFHYSGDWYCGMWIGTDIHIHSTIKSAWMDPYLSFFIQMAFRLEKEVWRRSFTIVNGIGFWDPKASILKIICADLLHDSIANVQPGVDMLVKAVILTQTTTSCVAGA